MTWDEYFINLLLPLASKSKDPRTKVSAICVGKNNELLGSGFNGFPQGVLDLPERYNDRETKYKFVCHAEANLVALAARNGVKLENSKLYIGWWPCSSCAKLIIQAGIKEIIIDGRDYKNKEKHWDKWKEDIDISKTMLRESSINCRIYNNGI